MTSCVGDAQAELFLLNASHRLSVNVSRVEEITIIRHRFIWVSRITTTRTVNNRLWSGPVMQIFGCKG